MTGVTLIDDNYNDDDDDDDDWLLYNLMFYTFPFREPLKPEQAAMLVRNLFIGGSTLNNSQPNFLCVQTFLSLVM